MKSTLNSSLRSLATTAVWLALLATTACSTAPRAASDTPEVLATPVPTDVWSGLLQRTPYPFTTPLPPPQATNLDGTYTKFVPKEGQRLACRRCAPYPPEGGLWLFQLDKGIFRVYSRRSLAGWRTLGSFSVSGDRIKFFNDPHCTRDVGVYTWKSEAGQLLLEVVEDECAFGLRAKSLTALPWTSDDTQSDE